MCTVALEQEKEIERKVESETEATKKAELMANLQNTRKRLEKLDRLIVAHSSLLSALNRRIVKN